MGGLSQFEGPTPYLHAQYLEGRATTLLQPHRGRENGPRVLFQISAGAGDPPRHCSSDVLEVDATTIEGGGVERVRDIFLTPPGDGRNSLEWGSGRVEAQAAMLRVAHTGEKEVVLLALAERCRALEGKAFPVEFCADVDVDAIRLERDTARLTMSEAGGWVSFTLRRAGRIRVVASGSGDAQQSARVLEAAVGAPVRVRLERGCYTLRFESL